MAQTFYFYDLETSGFNPRDARIMQFAGQRTDMQLKPVGEPHNVLIKMTEDTVPEPDAVLITGITPQKTIADGITEAEFLKLFHTEIATPGTIFVGYNSVRFDDEFMRFLHYRNLYDPYEWQWQDGKGRWDLLDVIRMMRALRPEGIKWPFDSSGKPSNRLELLTSVNKISHKGAHDALSDVQATVALARLMQQKQPKLFNFLLQLRDKRSVEQLVRAGKPFLYTSGKYGSDWEKTTVVAVLADHPNRGVLVYDLRADPAEFAAMTTNQIVTSWKRKRDEPGPRLPVKTLQFNRCPAVAPLSVLDDASKQRLSLDMATLNTNYRMLQQSNLAETVLKALEQLEKVRQASFLTDAQEVDAQLYDGFLDDNDRNTLRVIRAADPKEFSDFVNKLHDERLRALLPLYKARNYPSQLDEEERVVWERFRHRRLMSGKQDSRLAKYFKRLGELSEDSTLTAEQRYLLEELQLYGQGVLPETEH
jgi:exodeoxyribonuclease-1